MTAKIEILLEGVDNASGALKGVASSLGGLSDFVADTLSHAFGDLLSNAIDGATAALGEFVKGAMDSEKINAQLDAVIKSTGGAAGMTADQVRDMASALSRQTTYADDAILKGQNMLLTFTNIGKDVFPQATRAMVDIAAAMGKDVSSGAIQLGKALNDPVAGVSALAEVGVAFNDVAKDTIKRLVEQGDVAAAQRIILAELANEFGGSAAAAAETMSGKLEQMTNRLSDAGEGIVTALMPAAVKLFDTVITPAIPLVEDLAAWIGDLSAQFLASNDPLETARAALERLTAFLAPITKAVGEVQAAFAESMPMVQASVDEAVQFVRGLIAEFAPEIVANIAGALKELAAFWKEHGAEVMAVVKFLFETVSVVVGGALLLITAVIKNYITLVDGMWDAFAALLRGDWAGAWEAILRTLETIGASLLDVLGAIADNVLEILGSSLDELTDTWRADWDMLKTILRAAWDGIVGSVKQGAASVLLAFNGLIASAGEQWDGFALGLSTAWSNAWEAIKGRTLTAGENIKGSATALFSGTNSMAASSLDSFVRIWRSNWEMAGTIVRGVWDNIVSGAHKIYTDVLLVFYDLVGKVQKVFSLDTWIELGTQMMDGIKAGVVNAFQSLVSAVRGIVTGVVTVIKQMLGIRSPSRVFAGIGEQMMSGMSLGVTSGAPAMIGATQAAAAAAAQGAGSVTNNAATFNVYNYGSSPAENTARLRALAGAF